MSKKHRFSTPMPPEVGGRFNCSRAFRRAWDLGWRALGERAFSEERFQTWFQNSFESALKLHQNVCQMGPGGVLEASWRALGALKKAWSAQVGLPGACGSLLERSWNALGGLWGRKKVFLNGSWPIQDGFQESFQPSWGPKGSQNGGQVGPKSSPKGDSSWKWRNLDF